MRKLLFGLLIVALLVAACGDGDDATDTPKPTMAPEATQAPEPTEATEPEPAEEFKVGMISDVGGVDDASFNQTTWEGLERADNELEGVTAQFLESQAQAARVPTGAPPRRPPDLSALSPGEKILYGLFRQQGS